MRIVETSIPTNGTLKYNRSVAHAADPRLVTRTKMANRYLEASATSVPARKSSDAILHQRMMRGPASVSFGKENTPF